MSLFSDQHKITNNEPISFVSRHEIMRYKFLLDSYVNSNKRDKMIASGVLKIREDVVDIRGHHGRI